MVVYTNKKGTEFMAVENSYDIDESQLYLMILAEEGFHFSYQDSFTSDLLELIKSLPSKIQKGVASELRCSNSFLESYSDDELLETSVDLSFKEIGIVLNYLDKTLDSKYWNSWMVFGCSQGDVSYVWIYSDQGLKSIGIDPKAKFEDDDESDFLGTDWQEVLTQVLYWPSVLIYECDKFGNKIGYGRMVYGYSVDGQDLPYNESKNVYLDEYMNTKYGMKLAKLDLTKLYMSTDYQIA